MITPSFDQVQIVYLTCKIYEAWFIFPTKKNKNGYPAMYIFVEYNTTEQIGQLINAKRSAKNAVPYVNSAH